MPPNCDSRVGVFIDSLLSTSIHSICSAEPRQRVSSPSYPMNDDNITNDATNVERQPSSSSPAPVSKDTIAPTLTTVAPTPKRPPMPPSNLQQRKIPGLAVIIPPSPDDVHATPTCPVSLRRNVELKKKLSERHFLFRPVSEDDQSKASSSYTKASSVTRAAF